MYRRAADELEVFIVHPGGPLFARKDAGVWSVPKGEFDDSEVPLDVACREFHEETGQSVPVCACDERRIELGSVVQRGGKRVLAWAFEGDWPAGAVLRSNTFPLEWPRGSGRYCEIPEVDRGEFFTIPDARTKLNPAQVAFLDRLIDALG